MSEVTTTPQSYVSDLEVELQIQIGSTCFPTYPIRSLSESFSHLRKTTGLHFGSGVLNLQRASYSRTCVISAIDMEKMLGLVSAV